MKSILDGKYKKENIDKKLHAVITVLVKAQHEMKQLNYQSWICTPYSDDVKLFILHKWGKEDSEIVKMKCHEEDWLYHTMVKIAKILAAKPEGEYTLERNFTEVGLTLTDYETFNWESFFNDHRNILTRDTTTRPIMVIDNIYDEIYKEEIK